METPNNLLGESRLDLVGLTSGLDPTRFAPVHVAAAFCPAPKRSMQPKPGAPTAAAEQAADRVMASALAPKPSSSAGAPGSKPAGGKAAAKAIVKHSSFSSSLPSDLELLRKLKQTIASGAHPEFSAIIKPTAQKAVTVSREEADHQWELAFGDGLSGAEASDLARARREEEEAKQQAAEESVRLEKEKVESERRRVEQEARDAQARARAETAKMIQDAKDAERLRILDESRRIKEEFRKRKLAEEEADKAYRAFTSSSLFCCSRRLVQQARALPFPMVPSRPGCPIVSSACSSASRGTRHSATRSAR